VLVQLLAQAARESAEWNMIWESQYRERDAHNREVAARELVDMHEEEERSAAVNFVWRCVAVVPLQWLCRASVVMSDMRELALTVVVFRSCAGVRRAARIREEMQQRERAEAARRRAEAEAAAAAVAAAALRARQRMEEEMQAAAAALAAAEQSESLESHVVGDDVPEVRSGQASVDAPASFVSGGGASASASASDVREGDEDSDGDYDDDDDDEDEEEEAKEEEVPMAASAPKFDGELERGKNGWISLADADGYVYYYSELSGATQWDRPTDW
jgi:hypothetical protein